MLPVKSRESSTAFSQPKTDRGYHPICAKCNTRVKQVIIEESFIAVEQIYTFICHGAMTKKRVSTWRQYDRPPDVVFLEEMTAQNLGWGRPYTPWWYGNRGTKEDP
jgi:hypothetical protein